MNNTWLSDKTRESMPHKDGYKIIRFVDHNNMPISTLLFAYMRRDTEPTIELMDHLHEVYENYIKDHYQVGDIEDAS